MFETLHMKKTKNKQQKIIEITIRSITFVIIKAPALTLALHLADWVEMCYLTYPSLLFSSKKQNSTINP